MRSDFMNFKPRVPEGGAIKDTDKMSMEEYSKIMTQRLKKEYIKFAENVIKKVAPTKNSKVLEIGSGPGWAGINLLKMREDLYLDGLDASEDMVRVASRNAADEKLLDRVNYFHGFGEDMNSLPNDEYDLVISRDSMHHWDNPELVFQEISRVLKKDGRLYIHDSRRDLNIGGKIIVNILGPIMAGSMLKYWKSSIDASYTPEEIENILAKNDLDNWIVEADLMDLSIQKH